MPSSTRVADGLGAAAGIACAVLLFVSVASVDPQRGVSDQELQSWWADGGNRSGLVLSMYTMLAAAPLFLLFVSSLRMRLRAAAVGGWADTAFACGIVAATALGIGAVSRGVVASSMRFADEPLPGVDTLRLATSLAYATWHLAILFVAVLVAVVSILALTTRALPRWLGWFGVPVALGGVIAVAAHASPLALPLLNLWLLASGVSLLRAPAATPVGGPTWHSEVASAQT